MRSRFRPCIDLHDGKVKQIIGGTLSEAAPDNSQDQFRLKARPLASFLEGENEYCSSQSAGEFARLYRSNNLEGGHVIKLGPGNDAAARDALSSWPDGLQIGGGINDKNAQEWSSLLRTCFRTPRFSLERLEALSHAVGKDRLGSCRKRGDAWVVAMNKWQEMTDTGSVSGRIKSNDFVESLDMLSQYCSSSSTLPDVEGLCQGIDEALVTKLGEWVGIPCTYAGGAKSIDDLDLVDRLSGGKVDLTYGSALDIFGGSLVIFEDLVKHNKL
ncbi:Phosphoribosylformimino-5-aminoimidazole carboxamide ribotide isomerase [Mycena vulgaris]|nr:Phosphoribosylformimino-5-aminoimidazole carboxamide ribotide isomerase [Mycena vulgaris]